MRVSWQVATAPLFVGTLFYKGIYMRHVFRSLQHGSERAYTFEDEYDAFWSQISRGGSRAYVHERAGFFLTYGDGMVQHSSESAVPVSDMADYLGSLKIGRAHV